MFTKAQRIFQHVADRLKSPDFRTAHIQRPEDFSRQRKIGFMEIIRILLNRPERTSQVEVQRFCDNHLPTVDTYTKQAFSEARYKLKPEAFTDLNHVLIQNVYADRAYRTVEGWIPVGIDGSVLEIPNTALLREAYGTASGIARARMSHAYDVANHLCLSAILDRHDTSERDLARRNIAEVREIVPKSHRILWLEDRGYPSFPFWMEFDSQGEAYLMRVPSNFYAKEFAAVRRDEQVTITVTPDRAREFAEQGHPVPVGTQLTLRVIKLTLSTGETEILVTNVSADELPYAIVAAMYHLRWGVETHFDVLKNRCEIANFCGILPPAILQEHHATVLLSNMCALVEAEAQTLWDAHQAENADRYKYDAYKINTSVAFGLWKDQWMSIVLAEDPALREQAFWRLVEIIRRKVTPIRPGRSYPRTKAPPANRYSHKRRRSL